MDVLFQAEEKRGQLEFLYFASVELLTFGTFADGEAVPAESDPHRAEVVEALDDAFATYTLNNFLRTILDLIEQHKKMKLVLSDMFVHVTTKFLWHCWTQDIFRQYVDTGPNLQILAQLVPFLISWPNEDTQTMIGEVCLYAGLHRFPTVCDILLAEYREYPELACAMLTRCMISPSEETGLKPKQERSNFGHSGTQSSSSFFPFSFLSFFSSFFPSSLLSSLSRAPSPMVPVHAASGARVGHQLPQDLRFVAAGAGAEPHGAEAPGCGPGDGAAHGQPQGRVPRKAGRTHSNQVG